jgi:hypothetical protein
MKTIKTLGLVAAGLLFCGGLANATNIYDLGSSASLAALAANPNNYLTTPGGDKVFSDFTYNEDGLTSFNASGITVSASYSGGVGYLTWTGNMSVVSGAAAASGDLALGYTVLATAGTINYIDQEYAGSVAPLTGGDGIVGIVENVNLPNGAFLAQTTVGTGLVSAEPPLGAWIIGPDEAPYTTNSANPNGFSELSVVKDISISDVTTNTTTSVSIIEQSFHEVPTVPDGGATVSLLGVTLMGLGILRWKQSK